MPVTVDLRGHPYLEEIFREDLLKVEAQGEKRGKLEGKLEGELKVLRKLLVKRFGTLPEWAEFKLAGADIEMVEKWVEQALDKERLENILD